MGNSINIELDRSNRGQATGLGELSALADLTDRLELVVARLEGGLRDSSLILDAAFGGYPIKASGSSGAETKASNPSNHLEKILARVERLENLCDKTSEVRERLVKYVG